MSSRMTIWACGWPFAATMDCRTSPTSSKPCRLPRPGGPTPRWPPGIAGAAWTETAPPERRNPASLRKPGFFPLGGTFPFHTQLLRRGPRRLIIVLLGNRHVHIGHRDRFFLRADVDVHIRHR